MLGAAALLDAVVRSLRTRRWVLVVRVDRGLGADPGCRRPCGLGGELGFAVSAGIGSGRSLRGLGGLLARSSDLSGELVQFALLVLERSRLLV